MSARVNVAFLLQRAESWTNISGIWDLICADAGFNAEIWLLPYNAEDLRLSQQQAQITRDMLGRLGIPFTEWEENRERWDNFAFDVAVFTSPYDRERPSGLHFKEVAKKVRATLYVPYGVVVGAGYKNRLHQYAQPVQVHATAVIARSREEKEMYAKYCPSGSAHVHVTGLPRFDSLQNLDKFEIDPDLVSSVGNRLPVLWNSHFSFTAEYTGSADFSTFDIVGPEVFSFAANNPDIALIWRPHPGLFPAALRAGLLDERSLANFKDELRLAGIILDVRSDHRHAFAISRALITDLGSFLIEYLITAKPLLYLRNQAGQGLNDEGQALLPFIDVADSPEEVISFLGALQQHVDPGRPLRDMARARFLPREDGHSSERVVRLIKSMASSGEAEGQALQGYPEMHRLSALLRELRTRKLAGRGSPMVARAFKNVRATVAHAIKGSPQLLRLMRRLKSR
ncbi:CDP-glycerol glycerophosphotransferase family protein [Frateuria sp. MAH-13]|uniref:CDP-glycerol glycerophosphotransferase family protein n=1 Tax=Frateuria flava TaxID=2821489 RepID=A0ABS4DNP5_9GAMM|nr:CDP-glycerol glycerophosphotransferase family protein [Frateuria flava]MBP1474673.1 CDP-glycerol glycerophosphotransferase family protein [Frateuria flava]